MNKEKRKWDKLWYQAAIWKMDPIHQHFLLREVFGRLEAIYNCNKTVETQKIYRAIAGAVREVGKIKDVASVIGV